MTNHRSGGNNLENSYLASFSVRPPSGALGALGALGPLGAINSGLEPGEYGVSSSLALFGTELDNLKMHWIVLSLSHTH